MSEIVPTPENHAHVITEVLRQKLGLSGLEALNSALATLDPAAIRDAITRVSESTGAETRSAGTLPPSLQARHDELVAGAL